MGEMAWRAGWTDRARRVADALVSALGESNFPGQPPASM